ncbi:hypothetical protein OIV83_006283 [Microbotryomycetes sp. JL201]|nr:hypothetical protein OIV83_006283 [Microbotryomycetes sp. JL201]
MSTISIASPALQNSGAITPQNREAQLQSSLSNSSPKRNKSVRSSPKRPSQSKPRRKSFSGAHNLGHYQLDDESTGPPPWMAAGQPSLFRDASGALSTTGRPEDLVLPAVARRLQAERLERSTQDNDGLITMYDRQGRPLLKKEVPDRRRFGHDEPVPKGNMQAKNNQHVTCEPRAEDGPTSCPSDQDPALHERSPTSTPANRRVSASLLPLAPAAKQPASVPAQSQGNALPHVKEKTSPARDDSENDGHVERARKAEHQTAGGCCSACVVS